MRGWFAAALNSSNLTPPTTTTTTTFTLPTTPRRRGDIRHRQAVRRVVGEAKVGWGWGLAVGSDSMWSPGRERGWNYSTVTACSPLHPHAPSSTLSISQRGPRCIILSTRLARISAVPETKVISLFLQELWLETTYLCPIISTSSAPVVQN